MSATLQRLTADNSNRGFYHRIALVFEGDGQGADGPGRFALALPVDASRATVARVLRELADHVERYEAPEVPAAPPGEERLF